MLFSAWSKLGWLSVGRRAVCMCAAGPMPIAPRFLHSWMPLTCLPFSSSFGRLTGDDCAQLERIVDEARQATETGVEEDRRQIQRDFDFHQIIARASGNRRLVELMEQLMLPCVLYVTEAHEYLQRDFWVQIHAGLLEEIRSGNLEKSEARSISNARKIRELMFEHNARGHENDATTLETEKGLEQRPLPEASVELAGESAAHQGIDAAQS